MATPQAATGDPKGRLVSSMPSTHEVDWRAILTPSMREQYRRDGVLYIPQILHPQWLALIAEGMKRNVMHPGPHSVTVHAGMPGAYFLDYCNYAVNPEYQHLLRHSPVADIMQYILDTKELWLFQDQIFEKKGGNNAPTIWHQDKPHYVMKGTQMGSIWITLDPVPKKYCLEFIPGSHLGPEYAGSTFNPDDPTEPVYQSLPRMPDIEAERDAWNIVSYEITPGDVVILHPNCLHGGGATGPGQQRRTMTVRCFGDDVVLDGRFEREGEAPTPLFPGLTLNVKPGEPLRDPRFPRLRPV